MAGRAATAPQDFARRVSERVAGLPPTRMTAMQVMASFIWRPLAVMG